MADVRLRPANRPVDEVFPSQWLRVSDITQPTTLTIKQVGETDLYNPFLKKNELTIVLIFNERPQMLPCGPGRAKNLASELGENIPSRWTGRRIKISVVPGNNNKRGFKIEAVRGQPQPAPAEKSTTEPASPPAEKGTAKQAGDSNGTPSLPARPWDPESLKKALAYNVHAKETRGITGGTHEKTAQVIAGKMTDALAGPAREGQDAQERKNEIEAAKNAYHKCLQHLFAGATDKEGAISAKNLSRAESQVLLEWLLVTPTVGFKSEFKSDAVTELKAVRVMLESQPVQDDEDQIPF